MSEDPSQSSKSVIWSSNNSAEEKSLTLWPSNKSPAPKIEQALLQTLHLTHISESWGKSKGNKRPCWRAAIGELEELNPGTMKEAEAMGNQTLEASEATRKRILPVTHWDRMRIALVEALSKETRELARASTTLENLTAEDTPGIGPGTGPRPWKTLLIWSHNVSMPYDSFTVLTSLEPCKILTAFSRDDPLSPKLCGRISSKPTMSTSISSTPSIIPWSRPPNTTSV